MRGHFTPHSEETKQKMREAKLRNPVRYWLGKKLHENTKKAQLLSVIGNQFRKGKHFKQSAKFIEKNRLRMLGEKNHNWRGGISKKDNRHYYTAEYRAWRIAVFTRDNFKCQGCEQVGIQLQAHHIKGWANYPNLRFDINNGVTLCIECHKLTDNYKGRGISKKEKS